MTKRNRYSNKKKGSSIIDDMAARQILRGKLLDSKKTEQINIRVTPEILEWLRKQGNISKYIIRLIVEDFIKRGGELRN